MSILIVILHLLATIFIGIACLALIKISKINISSIIYAFITGMLIESSLSFVGLMFGIGLPWVSIILTIVSLLIIFLKRKDIELSFNRLINFKELKFWDWLLVAFILQKCFVAVYFLFRMPLYFDDSMTHWVGRAKAMWGGYNFSMNPASNHFLAKNFGHIEYPFITTIWRALNGEYLGSWNDTIARADGIIFFFILLLATYLIVRFLRAKRWIALGCCVIISSMQLQIIHATSGYSEITIQCISIVALLSIIKKEWKVTGLLLGAIIFTKNEGLVLYVPIFLVAIAIGLFMDKVKFKTQFINYSKILTGVFLFTLPWIIFKLINGVSLSTPIKKENYYHEGAISMFFDLMFNSPSSGIFWIVAVLFILFGILKIVRNKIAIQIFVIIAGLIAGFIYIFCFTGANIFMLNEMTIHRTLLQIMPLVIIFMVSLTTETRQKLSKLPNNPNIIR